MFFCRFTCRYGGFFLYFTRNMLTGVRAKRKIKKSPARCVSGGFFYLIEQISDGEHDSVGGGCAQIILRGFEVTGVVNGVVGVFAFVV